MFHAELISLSRGQSYDQIDILEARHGDFEKFGVPTPFGSRTVAFFYKDEVIIAHPWGVRIIHLDKNFRTGGEKCFEFDRIIIDGDISYQNGTYIDDDYFAELSIPDLFEDPGEVIDQVTFATSQGIFITHDANIVSIVKKYHRGKRGVTRSEQPTAVTQTLRSLEIHPHAKISRR
jgi:hypothetical protein